MKQRLADYIADFLSSFGVEHIFTVTGGGAMFLNDAFGNHERLKCIYTHHEQGAAIAAEGYTRSSGKPSAVCVTTGPGGTNALTGVVGAWLDSIPMIVISGQVKFVTTIKSTNLKLRQLGDQEYNITDSAAPMTKYCVMVTEPDTIRYHLERAVYLAFHGRPGPVWLDIPINVQGAIIETDELKGYDPSEDSGEIPPAAKLSDAKEVMRLISEAKRPVILGGNGIRLSGGYEIFLKLIEKLKIPVVISWNAHDLVWDDNPYSCGRPGTVGTRGGNFVVQNADLLISLSNRMNIRQISYDWQNFGKNARLIYIDADEAELQKPTIHPDMPIHADIKDFMEQMLKCDYNENPAHERWLEWGRQINKKYPAVLDKFYEKKDVVNPYVFSKKLSEQLAEGEVIAVSNGSACVCSFQAMDIKKGQRFFTNSGCASMGYGLPAAVGSAVAAGGRRVICLEGDGSIQMNIQELQTIVHNHLNVKIFLYNNSGYHSIRQTQTNMFNRRYCGIDSASGISFPDMEKIAAAYGIPFFRIHTNEQTEKVVSQVLGFEGAAICEAMLDPEQFFEPKLSSKRLDDGRIVSPSLEDMFPFLPEEEMTENRYTEE